MLRSVFFFCALSLLSSRSQSFICQVFFTFAFFFFFFFRFFFLHFFSVYQNNSAEEAIIIIKELDGTNSCGISQDGMLGAMSVGRCGTFKSSRRRYGTYTKKKAKTKNDI